MFRHIRCFLTDTGAASAVEFAFISIPLVVVLLSAHVVVLADSPKLSVQSC